MKRRHLWLVLGLAAPSAPAYEVPRFDDAPDPAAAAFNFMIRQEAASCGPRPQVVRNVMQQCGLPKTAEPGDALCFDILVPDQTITGTAAKLEAAPVEYPELRKLGVVGEPEKLLGTVVTALPLDTVSGTLGNFLGGQSLSALQSLGDLLDDPQTLGYTYVSGRYPPVRLRLGGFAAPQPELNGALRQRLIADNHLEAFAARENRLDLGDDYYISAELSLVTAWTGRDLEDHWKDGSALAQAFALPGANRRQAMSNVEAATEDQAYAGDQNAIYAYGCAAAVANNLYASQNALLNASFLSDFGRYIHNQPQLTLRYKQLHRDEIVGADARSLRLWFGSGIANNLTWLKLFSDCDRKLGGEACGPAYTAMGNSWWMKHGAGVSAYYERGSLADLRVELPDTLAPADGSGLPLDDLLGGGGDAESADFHLPHGRYQRYGWSLGLTMLYPDQAPLIAAGESWRLDAGADYFRYEQPLLSASEQDGVVLRVNHDLYKVTLTYRFGKVSIPLNLMYRTKTEFELEGIDRFVLGLGAGLGF